MLTPEISERTAGSDNITSMEFPIVPSRAVVITTAPRSREWSFQ
jgi:hypothetical protein